MDEYRTLLRSYGEYSIASPIFSPLVVAVVALAEMFSNAQML